MGGRGDSVGGRLVMEQRVGGLCGRGLARTGLGPYFWGVQA